MALIHRISRLLTADVHAVLDRIEEPAALLRQALREMEEELVHGERRIKRIEHDRAGAAGRRAKLEGTVRDLDAKLERLLRGRGRRGRPQADSPQARSAAPRRAS